MFAKPRKEKLYHCHISWSKFCWVENAGSMGFTEKIKLRQAHGSRVTTLSLHYFGCAGFGETFNLMMSCSLTIALFVAFFRKSLDHLVLSMHISQYWLLIYLLPKQEELQTSPRLPMFFYTILICSTYGSTLRWEIYTNNVPIIDS